MTITTDAPTLHAPNTFVHPIPTKGSVVSVVVQGISQHNPTQCVYVSTAMDEEPVVYVSQVTRNVRIDQYGVDVIDVEDALTPIHRADAVLAYRAAHDVIFNTRAGVQDDLDFRGYRLLLAHRTCERVEVGVRRS